MPENIINLLTSRENNAVLLVALSSLTVLLLIGWIVTALRLRQTDARLRTLTRGIDGHNLVELLTRHMDTVDATVTRMEALEQAVGVIQAQIPGCLQRVHMLRYDAFDDVGGQQSFVIAVLNARGDGILLTSVYSRSDIRVYAKSIQNGQASHQLSSEEERALREINAR